MDTTRHKRRRRYLVVINGAAGKCAKVVDLDDRIRRALGHDAKVFIFRFENARDCRRAVAIARGGNWDAVVAVGGDGTHHYILDGLAGTALPLGLIPLGTANDLAAHYDVPQDLEEACAVIRAGGRVRIDLLQVNRKCFATAGGMGLATDIALGVCEARKNSKIFHAFMRLVGSSIYTLYMVYMVLFSRRLDYAYQVETADGETRDIDGYMALVCNQGTLGKDFHAVPAAKNNDGEFDLLLLKKHNWSFPRLRLLQTLIMMTKAKHVDRPDVEILRARSIELRTPESVPVFADGELAAEGRDFRVNVLESSLTVLVPREHAEVIQAPPMYSRSGSGLIPGAV